MLVAIQEVMTVQTEILQTHGMSPAEFVWIEDLIYVTWTEQTELLIESSAITETIRETTARDMGLPRRVGTKIRLFPNDEGVCRPPESTAQRPR